MLSLVRSLLLGHDWLVRSPERLRLRCDHCRRETKGWALNHVNGPRSPRQGTGSSRQRGTSRLETSSTRKVSAADRPLIAA
jgi:hypothetical protein